MSVTDVVHVVRGKCKVTGRQYKLVRKQILPAHEVRGEDKFESKFDAIFVCIQAARAWRFCSPSVVFNVDTIATPLPGPPQVLT